MCDAFDFQSTIHVNENFWKVFQIQREGNVCSSFISYSLKVIQALVTDFIGEKNLILTTGYFDDS